MYYIARISGGTASMIAAHRAVKRYGRKRVLGRMEDVGMWEDEDTYRFVIEGVQYLGIRFIFHSVGKTPLQVAEERSIIPNSAMAPCSHELKIAPFEEWLWRVPKPTTILSGLSWTEPQRINKILHYHLHKGKWRKPQGFARRIPGVYEDFPLLWKPIEHRPYGDVVREWGIEPPRAYALGFSHNNCGGRCVRQGIAEWKRLHTAWPERFAEMRNWEEEQRTKGGARSNAAFSRTRIGGVSVPVTLAELEKQWQGEQCTLPIFDNGDDLSSCFCTDGE